MYIIWPPNFLLRLCHQRSDTLAYDGAQHLRCPPLDDNGAQHLRRPAVDDDGAQHLRRPVEDDDGAQHLRRPAEDDEGAENPRKPNRCKTYLGNKSIHHRTPATNHTPGISKVWADPADNPIGLGLGSRIVSAKWSQCNFKFAEFGGNVPGNTFVGSGSTVL
jgi:hypothetical protein